MPSLWSYFNESSCKNVMPVTYGLSYRAYEVAVTCSPKVSMNVLLGVTILEALIQLES